MKAKRQPAAGLVIATLVLTACGNTGGLDASRATPGADRHGQSVDGLTVGHRLMEAGEYDLALRAYIRAAAEQGADADVLSAIGSANLKLGRLGQAEQMLTRALELDPNFVPALNNLGVVLMERGRDGEAKRVFQRAFALDSGNSDSIRENLRLAIARTEKPGYDDGKNTNNFSLVRRGAGEYLLLSN